MKTTRSVVLLLLLALLGLVAPALAAPAVSQTPVEAAVPKTEIVLRVPGCEGCTVQPHQMSAGKVTYSGPRKAVKDHRVRFRVPTRRTAGMAFMVDPTFDEPDYGELFAVTGFRAKEPGDRVSDTFVHGRRVASTCWAGTKAPTLRNTLVVKKRKQNGFTLAAAYMRRTLKSTHNWYRLRNGMFYASDPSSCA